VNALTVLLLCAATYRLTRLIGADTITQPVRDRLERLAAEGVAALDKHQVPTRRQRAGGWAVELVSCPWCLSVHVGWWVAVVWWAAVGVADPGLWVPVVALTASTFAGASSTLLSLADDR